MLTVALELFLVGAHREVYLVFYLPKSRILIHIGLALEMAKLFRMGGGIQNQQTSNEPVYL